MLQINSVFISQRLKLVFTLYAKVSIADHVKLLTTVYTFYSARRFAHSIYDEATSSGKAETGWSGETSHSVNSSWTRFALETFSIESIMVK